MSEQRGELTDDDIWELKGFLEFATPPQAEIINALLESGDRAGAAERLSLTRKQLRSRIETIRKNARSQGLSVRHDWTRPVPPGFHVKGVSSYYPPDPERGLPGQWVLARKDKESPVTAFREALSDLLEDSLGRSEYIDTPTYKNEDLLCVYPLGDPHIGMLAWAAETGEADFDLKIAEKNILAAIQQAVRSAPAAREAYMVNLGDAVHVDSQKNTTTRGTRQDADGRLFKIWRVTLRSLAALVYELLAKHEKVTVVNERGNHDEDTALMLGLWLEAFFQNNPRVDVQVDPRWRHYKEFGKCLIGTTHGHGPKSDKLGALMSTEVAELWGRTKFRKFYCGHLHHKIVSKEHPGCDVEYFNTTAPGDAWHSLMGYHSARNIKVDIWHRNYGFLTRHEAGVDYYTDMARQLEEQ